MNNGHILIVDDEPLNLEILERSLSMENYSVTCAENGTRALEILQEAPEAFDAILLDRMMPDMDGLVVLRRIRAHPLLRNVPVILQTAKVDSGSIIEGLQAGAYYYLTKPFDEYSLLSVVQTAVDDAADYRALREETREINEVLKAMDSARFTLRHWSDTRPLARLLGQACAGCDELTTALWELLANAVEHGSLGMGYAEKSRFHNDALLSAEIHRREALPENQGKKVEVRFERLPGELRFVIQDQGNGFDTEDYMRLDPERVFDNHGRGILIARATFDRLDFSGNGNCVTAVKML